MNSAELDDYIGVESCADLKSDIDKSLHSGGNNRRRRRPRPPPGTYPPPIPWLARTENLPSHMPWVMKRYYSGDGRLIIREEKVNRHEYFQAHRFDGRLVLNLIPLDHAVEESCEDRRGAGVEESAASADDRISGGDRGIDGGDGAGIRDPSGAVSDCFKYTVMGVNPCAGFAVAVAAAAAAAFGPPLHT